MATRFGLGASLGWQSLKKLLVKLAGSFELAHPLEVLLLHDDHIAELHLNLAQFAFDTITLDATLFNVAN